MGDLLRLKDDDYVPADCVLLYSQKANGQAFIMTDALDGERNFKSILVLPRSQTSIQSYIAEKKMRIRIPEPNNDIYKFTGTIEYSFTG